LNKPDAHNELPDAVLVTGYKESGNQQYLLTLYQRYAGLLFGVCYKHLQSATAAQDACADIYVELVSKLQKHEVENFRGWLHVLAKNHCLQKIRGAKDTGHEVLTDDFVQSEDPSHLEEVIRRESDFSVMEKCMDELNEEQRQMVKLFYLEEKCYNDIVALTGKSWNLVRSHIQNGRRNLKNCIERTGSE
jgi:RNA polymerase sigma-70 factor (ECF subfamily)